MNWKQFKERFFLDPTRVLALSGGGARGMAHIGVLQHLDHLSLTPDLVTGTSMGALVGAWYCLHGSSEGLAAMVHDLFDSELFRKLDLDELIEDEEGSQDSFEEFTRRTRVLFTLSKMVRRMSVVEPGFMDEVMDSVFGDATFDDLKVPFVAVATDLYTGEDVALDRGRIATAVQASASIPGVFPPVALDGMLLVDGYVTRNVPVPEPGEPPIRADVIVVDVQRSLESKGPWENGIEVVARAEWIMQIQLNRYHLERADLVLVPDVQHVQWADFSRIDELIEAGHRSALEEEKKILRLFG
ncbi:MAG: patatin-like phospholipase family protein [Longimicrobiales bacterium]